MQRSLFTLVASAAAMTLLASSAHAADASKEDVAELRDMVLQLQDELRSVKQENNEQAAVLEEAGLAAEEGSTSALSTYLESTDFYGWVAASYAHNFRGHGRRVNSTFLYPDSQTFAVDQLWFGMDKAPTEESRGGYHVDIAYGKHAQFQGNNFVDGNDSVTVFAAYASFLAPVGNGVQFDIGELWTLIGAEVVQTPDNFNITRGLVWGLQPVTHTGLIASTDLGAGFSMAAGVVNEPFSDTARDVDANKAFTGQLAWGGDSAGLSFNTIVGDVGNATRVAIMDVVGTWDPTDSISLWLNYDYVLNDLDAPDVHGMAVAARVGITDWMGVAVRGEWVHTSPEGGGPHPDAYSATGTLDFALAENLILKTEYRYDDTDRGRVFVNPNDTRRAQNQHLGIAQLIYSF